jgi:hypothetical protein
MQGSQQESTYNNHGMIVSGVFHLILLFMFIIPFLTYNHVEQTPIDLEEGGLLVAFGEEDAGMNDAPVGGEIAQSSPAASAPNSPTPSDLASTSADVKVTSKPVEKPVKTPTANPSKSTASTNNKNANSNANSNAQADADARKKKFSNLFGKGSGSGGKAGNQGQPNGDPNGSALSGISTGSGSIGGGLAGRGVLFEPKFTDNSQKTGKVSLQVCVDPSGRVTKADFTQKGSTTSDPYLIDIAKKTTFKYKFSASEITSQCGSVTIDFKVQ